MEVEKRGVKEGFFQLFDWNVKSRKKLFSNKSESSEISHQGRENFHVSNNTRRPQGLENRYILGPRSQNDYQYASSASDDSEYGTKAPGVVARLMGLDSLPTSSVNEPCLTPYIESHSFRDSCYIRAAPTFQTEHDIVIFESVRNKLDGLTRNPLDLGLQKMHSRPIERFQREVIPPKSTKPVSVTHHQLLSPIKSPGFIPPKSAAYIIEAASKIIEQSPRSTSKGKLPPLGSSSVSIRVRDLKEKMETAHRSSRPANASRKGREQSSIKHMRKQHSGRGQGPSEDVHLYKGSEDSKRVVSQRLKNKEKSVSLAVHGKTNLQKRDSIGDRGSDMQKEHRDIRPSGGTRNFLSTQKRLEKPSSSRKSPEVLRLNNQKQNCANTKNGEVIEPSFSQPKERKDYVYGRTNRTVNKVVVNHVVTSRKMNPVAADPGKEVSSSRIRSSSKKKPPINDNIQSNASLTKRQAAMKTEWPTKCNIDFEGDSKWNTIDNKSSSDIVSFTFISPIKKSAGSNSRCIISNSDFSDHDSSARESALSNSVVSSSGLNVVRGDALSVLLEQKLKELTSRLEFPLEDMQEGGSFPGSSNSYGSTCPSFNLVNSLSMSYDACKGKQDIQNGQDSSLIDEGQEFIETNADDRSTEHQMYLDLRGSTSISRLPSFSGASTDSFDVDRSSCDGSVQGLSLESETMTWSSTKKSQLTEGDLDISDTASSLSLGTASETAPSNSYTVDTKDSSIWELKYIADILNCSDFLLEEFARGQVHKIIATDLFDQMESQKSDSDNVTEERFMHERKVLFDCVGECLEIRCNRLVAGSCKFWAKQTKVLYRKQWLAEELYREISGWMNVEELMVDELVDKDMSCNSGKWIDFEIEAFEEGIEIEKRILTSLVDELIDDYLV